MGIIGWIVLGLVAGAIAKALHSGNEPGGVLGTMAVGILGAIVGGLIASAVGIGSISSFFSLGTWLIAIGGALLLLVVYNAVTSGGRGARAT
ncbi:putative membrane protein YeaQ/YmgE (transglycosylase-associated protein family) [Solirubrobacter pauli]|uniref:Putative membrane protein YeaQ/YmgE (Transglycosylase-associated protein family) n=1 Tax=Solirubrobacter pauli TaxID=166793 RepID=A0A660L5L7_9ACTN|nr:GlsB/YeaQ/YmgE family stress response membrane protein [Solirubrobacter pauli]RKQ90277.1 putative membrane protein YeaQ/YmgE (transglycosylase-associated protein family) [Solirubrobacter pauli]